MRIVHIADSHLGLAAFSRVDGDGMNLRERLVYENFLAGIDHIIAQRPDVLVHAGDLFDRVRPKTRAYTTVLAACDRLLEADIPLVAIAGNHSMPKTRYTPSPFEVLAYHAGTLHLAYRYRYEPVEIGDVMFHLIPNMLSAADYRSAYDAIVRAPDHANVLVTHGLASMLSDHRLKTVAEHELDATILSADFDYIALGHFHDQRRIADNAWYSGSQEYVSYGEIRDTKGGLLVDTDSRAVTHLPLPHTPMMDLGRISCAGRSAEEIVGAVMAAVEGVPSDLSNPMCQLTLDGIERETLHALGRRELGEARSRVLDLRFRVIAADTPVPTIGHDLKTVDYVEEFAEFLRKHPPAEQEYAFVLNTGQEVLRTIMARHTEDYNAAP
ncbi:MAG: metallophosphoesterase [Methanomicrobiales archaeon]|nr:metallophosphoesterase [Methanomicrobiales archaeon]